VLATIQKQRAKRIYRTPGRRTQYTKLLSGLIVTVALPIVAIITITSTVLLFIFAEVYLMNRLCCVVTELRGTESSTKTKSSWKDPEDDVDRMVARNHSKGQFLK
jgi:hypothetical protein